MRMCVAILDAASHAASFSCIEVTRKRPSGEKVAARCEPFQSSSLGRRGGVGEPQAGAVVMRDGEAIALRREGEAARGRRPRLISLGDALGVAGEHLLAGSENASAPSSRTVSASIHLPLASCKDLQCVPSPRVDDDEAVVAACEETRAGRRARTARRRRHARRPVRGASGGPEHDGCRPRRR